MIDTSFWDKLAIKSYKTLIQQKPNQPILHYNLGIVYLRLKQNSLAIRELKKSIHNKGANAEAHYHLGVLYYQDNKHRKALACLKKYQELSNGSARDLMQTKQLIEQIESHLEVQLESA